MGPEEFNLQPAYFFEGNFNIILLFTQSPYIFKIHYIIVRDRGGTVVKVLCYKSEGRWFVPAGVSGFFIDITSLRSHYGLGVDSASNRNEYQEHFLGVKAAGA